MDPSGENPIALKPPIGSEPVMAFCVVSKIEVVAPVEQPQVDRTAGRGLAGRGHEALRVSHELPP